MPLRSPRFRIRRPRMPPLFIATSCRSSKNTASPATVPVKSPRWPSSPIARRNYTPRLLRPLHGTAECRRGSRSPASAISRTTRRSPLKKLARSPRGQTRRLRRGIQTTLRRPRSGPAAGTSRSPMSRFRCRSPWRFPPAATWNTHTRSCPLDSPKANGCRCPRYVLRASRMCIMPSSTSGRQIHPGCGTRPSASLSPLRT